MKIEYVYNIEHITLRCVFFAYSLIKYCILSCINDFYNIILLHLAKFLRFKSSFRCVSNSSMYSFL